MKTLRSIIEIDEELCDGCGLCAKACEEGAIQIINGKAKLVSEKLCDGLGACIGECPKGAIKIVEKEAEAFDHKAVEEHLKRIQCCHGDKVEEFEVSKAEDEAIPSSLTHWPVQIRLIPPTAPFLKDSHLLIISDCVAVAYPNLHTKLLPGRKVMMGCPKFDPAQEYVARLSEVLKNSDPRSVTLAIMEVPCCRGMAVILGEAKKASGYKDPIRVLVISSRGEVVREEEL